MLYQGRPYRSLVGLQNHYAELTGDESGDKVPYSSVIYISGIPQDVLHPHFLIETRVATAIGQPIARSSQDLFWLRLTGYWEHWQKPRI